MMKIFIVVGVIILFFDILKKQILRNERRNGKENLKNVKKNQNRRREVDQEAAKSPKKILIREENLLKKEMIVSRMIADQDPIVIAKTNVHQNPTDAMTERNPTEKNPIVNGTVLKQNGQTQDEMIENVRANDMIPENLMTKTDHETNRVIPRGRVTTKLNEGMSVLKAKVSFSKN